jgi:hypothetical protein
LEELEIMLVVGGQVVEELDLVAVGAVMGVNTVVREAVADLLYNILLELI